MIIVEVIGGLGNQMFQYATGRALAAQLDTNLVLDVSGFDRYQLHNGFELDRIFSGQFEIAPKPLVRKILGIRSLRVVKRILSGKKLSIFRGRNFIVEPHLSFWGGVNSIHDGSYLVGYWQSEKYFKSIESDLRKELIFKLPMSLENEQIALDIAHNESVSLHVRRGDYVQNANNLATHGVCSLEYYHLAIAHLKTKILNPKFYIFSDDIQWVKDNLKLDFPCCYIAHNHGLESYNDMHLMSLCKHNIIANSSFSWWGAWLNSNKEKIVIAPSKWFANAAMVNSDLLPEEWIKI